MISFDTLAGRLSFVAALVLVIGLWAPTTMHADPPPDLSLTKGHQGSFVVGSADATFTFRVDNGQPGGVFGPTTGDITVVDTLPTGMTYNDAATLANGWGCSVSGPAVTCVNSGPLGAGTFSSFAFRVAIAAEAVGGRTNSATVSTPGDSNAGNNTATDTVTVTVNTQLPDLSLTKGHQGSFVVGSADAAFTFRVDNGQPGGTTGPTTGEIALSDTLPTGMTYNDLLAPTNGWSCSANGSAVTCTNSGPIGAGAFSSFAFKVAIAAEAIGGRTNSATVSTPGDSNAGNNTATDTVTVGYTATATPTSTPPPTATLTPTVVTDPCSPRPRVQVRVEPAGAGRLRATFTASTHPGHQANALQTVVISRIDNATVDVPAQPGVTTAQTGLGAGQVIAIMPAQTTTTVFVQRARAGAFTAQFAITDGCSPPWPTFVGGGVNVP